MTGQVRDFGRDEFAQREAPHPPFQGTFSPREKEDQGEKEEVAAPFLARAKEAGHVFFLTDLRKKGARVASLGEGYDAATRAVLSVRELNNPFPRVWDLLANTGGRGAGTPAARSRRRILQNALEAGSKCPRDVWCPRRTLDDFTLLKRALGA